MGRPWQSNSQISLDPKPFAGFLCTYAYFVMIKTNLESEIWRRDSTGDRNVEKGRLTRIGEHLVSLLR